MIHLVMLGQVEVELLLALLSVPLKGIVQDSNGLKVPLLLPRRSGSQILV